MRATQWLCIVVLLDVTEHATMPTAFTVGCQSASIVRETMLAVFLYDGIGVTKRNGVTYLNVIVYAEEMRKCLSLMLFLIFILLTFALIKPNNTSKPRNPVDDSTVKDSIYSHIPLT